MEAKDVCADQGVEGMIPGAEGVVQAAGQGAEAVVQDTGQSAAAVMQNANLSAKEKAGTLGRTTTHSFNTSHLNNLK